MRVKCGKFFKIIFIIDRISCQKFKKMRNWDVAWKNWQKLECLEMSIFTGILKHQIWVKNCNKNL